jgi:hypothetical protein
MASILLWLSRLNALVHNAELDPFGRQPAESPNAGRCERAAIVSTDAFRKAVLAHGSAAYGVNMLKTYLRNRLASNQVSALGVRNC